jgi:hypothetical protein
VLHKYVPKGKKIDFLSVDAEGFDLIVLNSNDWETYRPTFVLVEEELAIAELEKSEIYQLMLQKKYALVAKTKRTLFFKNLEEN